MHTHAHSKCVSAHTTIALRQCIVHTSGNVQKRKRTNANDGAEHSAADVDRDQANVMYAVQQPLSITALGDIIGEPAWASLPSWYMVAKNDQAIPPDAERFFAQRMGATTVEIRSSHVAMVSHPDDVAKLIIKAGRAVS